MVNRLTMTYPDPGDLASNDMFNIENMISTVFSL